MSGLSSNGSFYGNGAGTLGARYKGIEHLERGKGTSHFLIYTESFRDGNKANTYLGTRRKDGLMHKGPRSLQIGQLQPQRIEI